MDPSLVTQAPLGAVAAPHDFSVWGLFLSADWIVKLVMLLLLATSVWCWGVIFEKIVTLRRLNARAADFEDSFWSGGSLETLYEKIAKRPGDPMEATFAAGMREWRHASDRGLADPGTVRAGLQQRVDRIMTVTIGRELARAERSMTLLATVGSTAPFVGLFGTVWGIIHAFTAIASENNTSLAVVAPGIAEALFTTALGLVAAIPAVVAYNKFSSEIGRYADRLDAFAGDFSTILSRHLEERA